MSLKSRSRIEIAAAILEATRDGVAKTRLMYTAFVSFEQAKEYLKILLGNGLMRYDSSDRKYYITPAGEKVLKIYGEMKKMFESSKIL
jgi:predicted transcriptional regulator